MSRYQNGGQPLNRQILPPNLEFLNFAYFQNGNKILHPDMVPLSIKYINVFRFNKNLLKPNLFPNPEIFDYDF